MKNQYVYIFQAVMRKSKEIRLGILFPSFDPSKCRSSERIQSAQEKTTMAPSLPLTRYFGHRFISIP